ncbi:MAG: hypothetical protein AABZ53_12365 [Planctomycetota bacterium]
MIEWFTEQQAGMIGGIGGALVGTIGGGVMGPMIGVCAPRGKFKGPILTVMTLFVVLGVGLLFTGLAAWFMGQPGHVIYVFVLMGFIMATVMGGLLPVVKRVYQQAERRKLDAEEFRRGT